MASFNEVGAWRAPNVPAAQIHIPGRSPSYNPCCHGPSSAYRKILILRNPRVYLSGVLLGITHATLPPLHALPVVLAHKAVPTLSPRRGAARISRIC